MKRIIFLLFFAYAALAQENGSTSSKKIPTSGSSGLSTVLTGFIKGSSYAPIQASDNLLQAIQKLEGNHSFVKTQVASVNYTLLDSDEFIAVTTSGITLNLPDPLISEGRKVSVVMHIEGSVNFNYPIYRVRSGSGIINTTVISTDISAGTGWSWNSVDLVVMNGQYWLY